MVAVCLTLNLDSASNSNTFISFYQVQCVFCSGVVGAWQEGDVPLIEHARLFPECPFILGLTFGLTQLERMDSITSSHSDDGTINAGVDVTGRFHISAVPVWANRPGIKTIYTTHSKIIIYVY